MSLACAVHDPSINNLKYLQNFTLDQANETMHDARWTRIVILRDPILRFASAYLDKCVKLDVNATSGAISVSAHCPVSDMQHSQNSARVMDALETAVRAGGFASVDAHVWPQSHFCDLKRFMPAYDAVDMDNAHSGLVELFRLLDVPEVDRRAALEALRQVDGDASLIPHATRSHALAASWFEERDKCQRSGQPSCQSSMVERIRTLYKDDYVAFCRTTPCDAIFD